ncbi:helix-turn-helix transcriptional regulator [Dongshaea marina]|uniref:helix-turn-helix transcriptional regulator n=1 Tax=Dongshaea marina TaxID=2047966 RepID=UPI000D3E1C36|nr:WYL domain-containing protein [Dongshaea marina]
MNWPLRWDLLLRYRFIEIVALWEGRLTTNHLIKSFGIGRQQASKDINTYIKEHVPDNLVYDKSLKGYTPTPGFTPKFTTGTADEYLHLLSRNTDIRNTFSGLDLGLNCCEALQIPLRNIEPTILRPLVQAARNQKRVELDYISMHSPEVETRVIAPHTLVCTPLRWHLRAYCEKNRDYRDFVLSRFRGEPDIMDASPNPMAEDQRWMTEISIILEPDSRLNPAQRAIIEHDYGMRDGKLEIATRGALVGYTLPALNIDPHKCEQQPEAQQIQIANRKALEPYLF